MTIKDEIITIANRIANEGKKPSVALIKTKLSEPVPLPTIIAVLKKWQHNPNDTEIAAKETEVTKTSTHDDTSLQAQLALALAPLHQELIAIKKELAALKARI